MRVENAFVGARLLDSLAFSQGAGGPALTKAQCDMMRATGVEGFIGYLGAMSTARLQALLSTGLAFMPVTFAGEFFDGAKDEIAQLKALDIPPGACVWIDVEGRPAYDAGPEKVISLVNSWGVDIEKAGFIPCLYSAAPQPLSGPQLAALRVYRYWSSASLLVDWTGKQWPEPTGIGWCMYQLWHGETQAMGQWWPNKVHPAKMHVDVNSVQKDRRGRLPTWVVRD